MAFGTSEGVIYSGGTGTNTISASITGSGGLTVFGPTTLALTAASNSYTGTTTIDGNLTISAIRPGFSSHVGDAR